MGEAADIYAPEFVRNVFDRTSRRYIWFSSLMSFGFTGIWRKQCVAALPRPVRDDPVIFDLMAGTGEVWPHLLARFPRTSAIHAVDISEGMHRHAIDRLHRMRAHRITFTCDDVLASRLDDASADVIVSTFGLKTFNADQHQRLAALIVRVLRPSGSFALIEASEPQGWWLRGLYMAYLTRLLPMVERFLLRGAQDFAMIGTYCTNFRDAAAFAEMLRDAGLEVRFRRHFFGCATSVSGRRPG